ncbi:ATPase, type IV secretory pathway VirB11 component like protein [Candidatus Nitrososphaera evergladensis SR1]|uniref:ATPase, type IV secretory pathway VirB11 component like protein n=1 Tax=Candidatus Nitrososphaera evergladensis SR1 TaxID=1459636 RepID=A0A075MYR4_9ARCH|nr:type II/IV secretion system ATPase subunit [Candidatus Nitrososphaera evergladensis]AIF84404.1 ATPase, type IV secretory pathway VirB11 component like protein [Candidatus Nitrososphaera evergladensis SR1]
MELAAQASSSSTIIDKKLLELARRVPHLSDYLQKLSGTGIPMPTFYEKLDGGMKNFKVLNLIYPVTDQICIHINSIGTSDGYTEYVIVDPPEPNVLLSSAVDRNFAINSAATEPASEFQQKMVYLEEFLKKICTISKAEVDYGKLDPKAKTLPVYEKDFTSLVYHFIRKRAGLGLLEPFLTDPYLEDISIIGQGNVFVVHKVFGPLKSPVWLTNDDIDGLVIGMSEQFGKTVSHARPVIDATLPEGSRINIVFGKDVSRKGTNATIRRFASVPLSITQIISSKTLDKREAAYMWMMVSEGMSCFINGETASGKTTTMMGITLFIPPTWKVVTIEDTPEITLPHNNWISEVTRDTGSASSSVTMFDLLKAALRQRPNYILVGEIRGVEGNIAFQAMQTGHPVVSTFHAAQMSSLIQRLTGDPIKVPKPNVENLNIALFQAAVQGKEGKPIRRVLSINEIVGYNSGSDSVMFIPIFTWDPSTDSVTFRGRGSSNLFVSKLLLKRGMARKDEGLLYDELELRAAFLERLIQKKIFNYYEVYDHLVKTREIGLEAAYKELGKM